VAKYVHENDMTTAFQGRQNLTVYTIGFNPSQLAFDSTLLQSTASKGGGRFTYCHNAQTFKAALQSIIEEILEKSVSYVAPTVPISQMERTTSVDRIYLGMFKPTEKSFWKGNVKKFGIATTANASKNVVIGDVIDLNGDLAIDPATNEICDLDQQSSYTATSYWSTAPDGSDVEQGGVGAKLQSRDFSANPRKIYTYNTSVGNTDLTHSSNVFNTTNITPAALGYTGPTAADDASKLIDFLYGYDAYDEDGDSITAEKRSWVLGAIIHSRPFVVQYASRTVIYVGANDGMLHAFDDTSGEELWAFIPPDLLPRLQNLTGNTIEFFLDGSPKVYEGSSQKILVCGERRGGNRYFALDITDPLRPLLLWQIHPGLTDYSEMGQTWSTPFVGKIKYGTTSSWIDKWVIFIGGGYDTNQDSLPVPSSANDSKGYAVYVVDVFTGGLIWKYTKTNNALMKYSIPSDFAKVDTDGDGRIDRLYVGDMGGQLWRFDLSLHETISSPTNWTAKLIFKSNDPAPTSGDLRKIFYPPDVGLEMDSNGNYELIIFGTGDREHPSEYAVYNRLYTVKDRNPTSPLKESDLVDVTLDLLQTGTAEQKQTTYN
jgi:type IV pilus assembly protein PilY1